MPLQPIPEWVDWELSFTPHAELRMQERDVSELQIRAMLQSARGYNRSVVEGRFMIQTEHSRRPWIIIVEPDIEAKTLVIVTAYEVSQ